MLQLPALALAAAHGDAQLLHVQAAFEVEAQGEGAGAGLHGRLQCRLGVEEEAAAAAAAAAAR